MCDCDGFTSSAIMYQYIKDIIQDTIVDFKIHDGKQHGLEDHIDDILTDGTHYDLIICPDAGSNDYEIHEKLKELGTRVLVIDHHDMDDRTLFSDNAVIVNNQISENYPNKDLTGAGVTWQFCRYFDNMYGYDFSKKYIDLAAYGVIGDMANVVQPENAYIIKKGTAFPCENKFLNALVRKQAYSITGSQWADDNLINEKLTPTSIAFYVVPYINAMVRSGSFEEKVRMFKAFIDGDSMVVSHKRGANGALEKVVVESVRECTNAKSRQDKLKNQMAEHLEIKIHKHGLLDNKILVVRLDDDDVFPPELNGLIAMQLSAKFKKPTIVARLNNEGYIRGSARGLNDSELNDFKQFLLDSQMFEYAQGHSNAFGISLPNGKLAEFHKYANEALKDIDLEETSYNVDFIRQATASDLEDVIMDIGNHPEIWGQGCKTPLIYITDINLKRGEWQVIGSKKNTLKFSKNGIDYIKFFATDLIEEFAEYDEIKVNIIGEMNVNEWNGYMNPQIMIKEAEVKNDKFGF